MTTTKEVITIVAVSDTHGINDVIHASDTDLIPAIKIPSGDIFIYAGDFCNSGALQDVLAFNRWLTEHDIFNKFRYVVVVAGNHDIIFENSPHYAESFLHKQVIYLKDNECKCYYGSELSAGKYVRIYGSPWSLEFNNWAFMKTEEQLAKKFAKIPEGIDILVTHSPPYGILDVVKNDHLGSKSLADKVKQIKPKVHIFGHLHEGYGHEEHDGIHYYNVSILDGMYSISNKPTEIEL